MVCFAWAKFGTSTTAATHHLPGDRQAVREASVVVALEGLLARL
jgi:nicotinamide mononucleotide (NMN) deamidase PncC